ncbi:hypothetical protein Tco_0990080 [Tanacetum coccineum]|uniref:Uncharacterized protein n=1 Tax=Tanacetum coccineum TaxID=301880 RepID=A0ABQ5EVG3_9ASTR
MVRLLVYSVGWAYAFHQDKASSVKVPVANVTLFSSAHLLRENTDSAFSRNGVPHDSVASLSFLWLDPSAFLEFSDLRDKVDKVSGTIPNGLEATSVGFSYRGLDIIRDFGGSMVWEIGRKAFLQIRYRTIGEARHRSGSDTICNTPFLHISSEAYLGAITTLKRSQIFPHLLPSTTTFIYSSQDNQTFNLVSPSFSVYTSTPPQVFEIGKCSDKMYLKHHEKQVEDILNYLDELHLHRIERMEEERTNGNELKTELKRIRTQIIKLQKKKLGQKDKIAFAHYRISNLEQIIKEIQARHQTDQEDL